MAEIGSNSLIDEMYTEEARLKSFKNWPFDENVKCSASKMAEAGFFHCPTEKELDLVQCYVCYKELDGWEADDEPWAEHLSHAKTCVFAKIHKPQRNLTLTEIYEIEAERKINKHSRMTAQVLEGFKSKRAQMEDFVTDVFDDLSKTEKPKRKAKKK